MTQPLPEADPAPHPDVAASRAAFAPPYDLTEDPHRDLRLPTMLLWLLILIPLHQAWRRLLNRSK